MTPPSTLLRWMRLLGSGLVTGALLYAALVAVLFVAQRKLLYVPTQSTDAALVARAERLGMRPWIASDGAAIGWRSGSQPDADVRLLVLHGNGGDALGRMPFVRAFERLGWDVVLLEYPGYGARTGAPTEESLTTAGVEALAQLRREDARPVVLLGESLGSGVAAQVAQRAPVDGLFLVTPFDSMVGVAADHFPLVPARLVLRDQWESGEALRAYRGPLAVLLAGRDTVVPTQFGQALFDGFGGPKRLWVQPERDHNTLDLRPDLPLWKEVAAFVQSDGQ